MAIERLQGWLLPGLAFWLIVSGWLLAVSRLDPPSWSAGMTGVFLALLSVWARRTHRRRVTGLFCVLIGLWLFAAPLALGFVTSLPVTANSSLTGSILILLGVLVWAQSAGQARRAPIAVMSLPSPVSLSSPVSDDEVIDVHFALRTVEDLRRLGQ
ncbi:MAG TPA: hypothetical protein VET26_06720 [Candidatus Sulfotelmatobacter sp.]|nr:hypothetical protein [Candidatus Sulfotelmatobacter sp.]